jgi:small subunit ribosomal protein S16
MLKIRLQRVGKKHEPVFRIVVCESTRGPKAGDNIETLGSYDPRDKNEATFNEERIKHWISVGAQVSDTVHNLLIKKGIIEGKKVNALPKKSPIVKELTEEEKKAKAAESAPKEKTEEAPAEEVVEAPVAEEAPVEEKVEEPVVEEAPAAEENKEEEKIEAPVESAPEEK